MPKKEKAAAKSSGLNSNEGKATGAPPTVKTNIQPVTNKVNWSSIPAELQQLDQWVVWRYKEEVRADGSIKKTKPPYQIDGSLAKSTDPKTWNTFDKVKDAVENGGSWEGVGFVLTETDPFAGIDLDGSVVNGIIKQDHQDILKAFDSYAEVTPSGEGYRVLVKYNGSFTGQNDTQAGVEIYSKERYLTVTGQEFSLDGATGRGVKAYQQELDDLRKKYRSKSQQPTLSTVATSGRSLQINLSGISPEVQELIANGAAVGKRSEAMMKVYNYLIYAGYSLDNIVTVFKAFPQGIGEKFFTDWKQDETKLKKDIRRAIDSLAVSPQVGELLAKYAFMVDGQRVVELKAHPSHAVQGWYEFEKNFASSKVLMPKADNAGMKAVRSTKLWLEHPARRTIRAMMFDPNRDRIFELYGKEFFNSFYFIHDHGGLDGFGIISKTERDRLIQPVLDHALWLMNSDPLAYGILMDWLAGIIQFAGQRPKWCPLLISETQGIGKDLLLSDIMSRVLGSGLVRKDSIRNLVGFGGSSGWGDNLYESKLVVVSEAKDSGKSYEVNERMRSLMIDDTLYLNLKGKAAGTFSAYCAMAFLSNDRDALKIPFNDRRIWPVELHHTKADREARKPQYKVLVEQWLNDVRGHRAMFEWLKDRKIQTDIHGVSPSSIFKDQLVQSSISDLEKAFDQAIELELAGKDLWTPTELNEAVQKCYAGILGLSGYPIHPMDPQYKKLKSMKTVEIYGGLPVPFGAGVRKRMVAVRNRDKWTAATPHEIRVEYKSDFFEDLL